MRRQRGLETAACLPVQRHSQKSHCRPFTEHKKTSGCSNEEGGKGAINLMSPTDTGKNAQLMVYVRYEGDTDLKEKFLFCTPLTTTATGADIFNVVDNFQQQEGINWKNCVSL